MAADAGRAFSESGGRYGARRTKAAPARRGVVASRRRISRAMRASGLVSCHAKARLRPHPGKPNEADLPNILNRELDGHGPRARVASDLTYVRVRGAWRYACLLIDPCNREIVGHAASDRKDARLVKAAFATVAFPPFGIEALHADRGSESGNAAIDEMLGAFGIERPLSKRGCPHGNAVDESADKALEAELTYRESFEGLHDLQAKLGDHVWRHDNERMHSTLGYMSPVEFRKAGLSL